MAFNIVLGVNNSPKNQIVKDTTVIDTYPGTLKDVTSIIDPVVMIECDLADVKNANYMRIAAFNRYYFIENIRSVRNGLVEFSCHVDVLTSFASEIKSNRGIIKRNAIAHNIHLNDGYFKVYQDPHIVMYEFPNGFTTKEFVLAMAGS